MIREMTIALNKMVEAIEAKREDEALKYAKKLAKLKRETTTSRT